MRQDDDDALYTITILHYQHYTLPTLHIFFICIYVIVYHLNTWLTELKQDNQLDAFKDLLYYISVYSMGPSKAKGGLGEKYNKNTKGLFNNKYNYKP